MTEMLFHYFINVKIFAAKYKFSKKSRNMVFCYQNCSDLLAAVRKNCSSDQEKVLKFEAEGQKFAKCLRSNEQFIQTVKGQNNFWQQNAFLTGSWRFLISNK